MTHEPRANYQIIMIIIIFGGKYLLFNDIRDKYFELLLEKFRIFENLARPSRTITITQQLQNNKGNNIYLSFI